MIMRDIVNLNLATITSHRDCYDQVCRRVRDKGFNQAFNPPFIKALHQLAGLSSAYNSTYRELFLTALYEYYEDEFGTLPTTSKEKGKIMLDLNKKEAPVKTIQYVFGVDITKLSQEQFVATIHELKARIKELTSLGIESKKVKVEVATLEKDLATIITAYDKV